MGREIKLQPLGEDCCSYGRNVLAAAQDWSPI